MKLLGIIIFVVAISLSAFAFEDLGTLASARKAYPEIFIPGSVNVVTIKSISCYVFSGEAEQCFTGEFAEPESELYDEATLSAKSNFFEFLTKKDKTQSVTMSQCSILYRYNSKKTYTVILFVPQANVSIKKTPRPAPQSGDGTSNVQLPAVDVLTSSKKTKTNSSPSISAGNDEAGSHPVASVLEQRINKYIERIKTDPNNIIAYSRLGDLYQEMHDFEKAIKNYRTAVRLVETSEYFDQDEKVKIILSTAQLCERLGKNNLALKYYNLVLKCKCSREFYNTATSKISKIRLKMID